MRPQLTIVKNSRAPQTAQGQGSVSTQLTPAQRVERARARVKTALHAAEDGDMAPITFDGIARPLVEALRDLEALAISVAVMSRAREVRTF